MESWECTATSSVVNSTHDSESLSVLPPEIIFEILLRLPVKALVKMRCVSKSWLSLISTPQFIKTHLKFSSKNQGHKLLFSSFHLNNLFFYSCSIYSIMYQESPHVSVELHVPCIEPFFDCIIVGSCDGLFCISGDFGHLFLWNPSIRKSKKLPFSGSDRHYYSYLAYGFGYNECQDDYKVVELVGISHKEYGFQNEFRVYSSRTNSWERIQDYPGVIFCNDPAKFVSGRLHWIATRISDKKDSWFVSALSLVDETLEHVPLPDLVDGWELGTLGGNLCVFCDCHKVQMDVWVMKEYGLVESWTKIASIPYLTAIDYSVLPIFISRNDEIFLQYNSSLLLYNSTHNTFKHPQIQFHCGYGIQFTPYIESLVSPSSV